MDFNQILELIRTVSASDLTTFRYEEGNQKILMHTGNVVLNEMEGESVQPADPAQSDSGAVQNSINDINVANAANVTSVTNAAQGQAHGGKTVKSPLVGRFYTAPSEDAEPFVRVGDRVQKGQTLAIVEAMKLMNEIESDYDGVVTEILAENAQSVEYGQPLFTIA